MRITSRQYRQLAVEWVSLIALKPSDYGTHSLRRTKAPLVNKRAGSLRACQLLLGHTKLELTARYLGIEADDALSLSELTKI
jgi:integrase